ncbi:unnamed protein product [Blepharisma stoltei]|uniref:Uncharacterized protein n=1 Tax=Blepharisma stoltei TaxID=1481888 RepID=A0AAU9JRR0_9CILI|nr:unnamed protein product [Blepharisma stoltei]
MWWENFQRILKNPRKFRNLTRRREIKYWLLVILILILIYLYTSNGDFSFFLTLCSTLQMISFIGICIQVTHNTDGLSFYSFLYYSIIYFSRLNSIIPFENYLPYDTSGDWFYQIVEIASFGQSLYITSKLFEVKESPIMILYSIPCIILSLFVHATLNRNFLTDWLWTLSMYMEAVALIPLIEKLKSTEAVENFSVHFVAARAASQIMSSIFWFKTYRELNKVFKSVKINLFPGLAGYFVLGSQIISCFFTANFFIYYVKSAAFGTPFILPFK